MVYLTNNKFPLYIQKKTKEDTMNESGKSSPFFSETQFAAEKFIEGYQSQRNFNAKMLVNFKLDIILEVFKQASQKGDAKLKNKCYKAIGTCMRKNKINCSVLPTFLNFWKELSKTSDFHDFSNNLHVPNGSSPYDYIRPALKERFSDLPEKTSTNISQEIREIKNLYLNIGFEHYDISLSLAGTFTEYYPLIKEENKDRCIDDFIELIRVEKLTSEGEKLIREFLGNFAN